LERNVSPSFERVQRFLVKLPLQPGWNFSKLCDARQAAKCRYPITTVVWAGIIGFIANKPTLRDVEAQTADLNAFGRRLVPERISDTTLHHEFQRLDEAGLREQLIAHVRALHRQKRLVPFGVPCGVATFDGKNLATLNHHAAGSGHRRSQHTEKWARTDTDGLGGMPYWLMPAIRVTLTSAEAKPCIDQHALLPGEGEETVAEAVVRGVDGAYRRSGLIEVMDFDAGFTSLGLANVVDELGYAYVFGLKGNQPTLYGAARRALVKKADTDAPEAQTAWERRNGNRIRRSLYRTTALGGMETTAGLWTHLRQAWLVRQETLDSEDRLTLEDRYFITSLLWNRLRPMDILNLVRGHWGVENDTFNSLDLQWREDHGPWCTQGRAVWVLGWLRLMAYNVVQLLRRKTLRKKTAPPHARILPWRQIFTLIAQVLVVPWSEETLVQAVA
jgi:hypothetical protein